ncbi:MAG: hypothetical protein EBE86_018665 [Hormoscilla sp. GUM202]|nr:hypothetical protein [Hormoscilla sp. GUM202]
MRVLIITEDFRNDQYILQPIIMAMMKAVGKPKTQVEICRDPLLGGVTEALKWERIEEIIDGNRGQVDIFLLCVDRDGREGRKMALDRIEEQAANILAPDELFLAANAWQEIEVWVLAGHNLPADWNWQAIRNKVNPKETYFLPFAEQRNAINQIGEGRKLLASEAARRYNRLRQLCPEIADLENRIRAWIEGNT